MPLSTQEIWEHFCCKLDTFIASKISNQNDVNDIQQEIFLKIHSRIGTLQDNQKMESWVYKITRNTIIDYYRQKKNNSQFNEKKFIDSDAEMDPESHTHIASGLKELITLLPEKYAQALLLTDFKGVTQTQLAKKLGISISGAKSRVQRARAMVRDELMNCCHFEFDKYGTIIDHHPIHCCCCSKR